MAHPLTHLTHGIPTRRPFHPAKTAKSVLKPSRLFVQLGNNSRKNRQAAFLNDD
jgi:hypothetical protein